VKVISGGQTGADQAGLAAAKSVGFQTGGIAPKHYRTLEGSNYDLRDLYNLEESNEYNYKYRTEDNVKNSSATIRLAFNFNSSGEKCTLAAIKKHNKPYIDIDLNDKIDPTYVAKWIIGNDFDVLNVAGNSDTQDRIVYSEVFKYLVEVFEETKRLKEDIF